MHAQYQILNYNLENIRKNSMAAMLRKQASARIVEAKRSPPNNAAGLLQQEIFGPRVNHLSGPRVNRLSGPRVRCQRISAAKCLLPNNAAGLLEQEIFGPMVNHSSGPRENGGVDLQHGAIRFLKQTDTLQAKKVTAEGTANTNLQDNRDQEMDNLANLEVEAMLKNWVLDHQALVR